MFTGKSCLKEIGGPTRHRQVTWSLSKYQYKREIYQYRYSSYQRYYWSKWCMRTRQLKPRVDKDVISICEIAAREKALILAKQCKCSQGAALVSTSGRSYILDSGASFNLIGKPFLTRKEIARVRTSEDSIELTTAVGKLESNECIDIFVQDFGMSFTFWVLPEVPPVLSIGHLVKQGFSFTCESVNDNESMRVKTPHGQVMDSCLVNDVPRIYVAEKCSKDKSTVVSVSESTEIPCRLAMMQTLKATQRRRLSQRVERNVAVAQPRHQRPRSCSRYSIVPHPRLRHQILLQMRKTRCPHSLKVQGKTIKQESTTKTRKAVALIRKRC